jgi:two-component system chemotaxis response regulator CheY
LYEAAPNEVQRVTAFIVEDDEEMRSLIKSLVLQLGFKRVEAFARLEPAAERLEYDAFGLGIVGLNVGDQNGASLIATIRSNPRACVSMMPILVAASSVTGERIQSAIQAGADSFLCKPFSVSSLKRQIQRARTTADARLDRAVVSKQRSTLARLADDVLELD